MGRHAVQFVWIFGIFLALAAAWGATEKITAGGLRSLLSLPDVIVIDLRSANRESGISLSARAVHEDPPNVPAWAAKYSKNTPIVLFRS